MKITIDIPEKILTAFDNDLGKVKQKICESIKNEYELYEADLIQPAINSLLAQKDQAVAVELAKIKVKK